MHKIDEVKLDSFQIKPAENGDRLVIQLAGTGDMAAVEPLNTTLKQVQKDMTMKRHSGVHIDITALYLLNSSCIKALVRFIYLMQTEGPEFPVQFLVDSKLTWQPRALAALKRLAPKFVTITPAT